MRSSTAQRRLADAVVDGAPVVGGCGARWSNREWRDGGAVADAPRHAIGQATFLRALPLMRSCAI
jgi:hypothetical protein